jgi:hypothetical protein
MQNFLRFLPLLNFYVYRKAGRALSFLRFAEDDFAKDGIGFTICRESQTEPGPGRVFE